MSQQQPQYYNQYFQYAQQHSTTDPLCEQYFSEVQFAIHGYIQCKHNDCIAKRQRENKMYNVVAFADDDCD